MMMMRMIKSLQLEIIKSKTVRNFIKKGVEKRAASFIKILKTTIKMMKINKYFHNSKLKFSKMISMNSFNHLKIMKSQ